MFSVKSGRAGLYSLLAREEGRGRGGEARENEMKLLPVKTNKDSYYIRSISNSIKGNLAIAKRRKRRKERGRDEEIIK
jgi:hypothetical protein